MGLLHLVTDDLEVSSSILATYPWEQEQTKESQDLISLAYQITKIFVSPRQMAKL